MQNISSVRLPQTVGLTLRRRHLTVHLVTALKIDTLGRVHAWPTCWIPFLLSEHLLQGGAMLKPCLMLLWVSPDLDLYQCEQWILCYIQPLSPFSDFITQLIVLDFALFFYDIPAAVTVIPQAAMISLKRIHVSALIHAAAFCQRRKKGISLQMFDTVCCILKCLCLLLMPHPSPDCPTLHCTASCHQREVCWCTSCQTGKSMEFFTLLVFRIKHSAYYRLVGQHSLLSRGFIYVEPCSVGAAESQVY